jgi:hypothetical protein
VTYGVRTLVDLRHDEELASDPPRDVPVTVVRVPVLGGADKAYWRRLVELSESAPTVEAAVQGVYESFLEQFHTGFATAVAAVARASEGCVVVHCVEGKDRTGLVTGLLLRLAGVPVEQIAADYALSRSNLGPRLDPWVAAGTTEADRARRERIAATPARALAGALARVELEHGSVGAYLRHGGIEEDALAEAEALLRG